MRILVLSDSHENVFLLRKAIENHRDASAVVYLGDGEDDMLACRPLLSGVRTVMVRGNWERGSDLPESTLELMGGKRVWCTHGHRYNVKHEDEALQAAAARHRADIILYGHTHRPVHRYVNGAHFFNPGSVWENSCGVVDITAAGIVCIHKRIIR